MSSAMTQIDLMAMKVPTVVKINTEKPELTFHEYMPNGYPYMYEKVEDMEKEIINLLNSPNLRSQLVDSNYTYWLKNNENYVVKEKYIKVMEDLISGK